MSSLPVLTAKGAGIAALALVAVAAYGGVDADASLVMSSRRPVVFPTLTSPQHFYPWRVPPVPSDRHLFGVNALSPSEAWAVGYEYAAGNVAALAIHWDGQNWQDVQTADLHGRQSQLYSVSAVSSTDVWAIGNSSSGPLIEHWDGVAWSEVENPQNGHTILLEGVSAVSASDVWAVGTTKLGEHEKPLTEHWDGQQWTIVPSPGRGSVFDLSAVSAVSSSDVWAAGSYGHAAQGIGKTLIEHWDGKVWSRTPSPQPGGQGLLTAISAVTGSDVWAVGWFFNRAQTHYRSLIAHWNGSRWVKLPSPSPRKTTQSFLYGVSAVSSLNAWAVGAYRAPNGAARTLIQHWDGTSWTNTPSRNPGFPNNNTLWAVSAASGASAWAVGDYVNVTGSYVDLTEHWNGKRWNHT